METKLASQMKNYFPPMAQHPPVGQDLYRGSRSHSDTPHV